jgi:hypothetical protein
MFEQEMKEETVNEVGVLICSCKVRNVDEEGGDSEAWYFYIYISISISA